MPRAVTVVKRVALCRRYSPGRSEYSQGVLAGYSEYSRGYSGYSQGIPSTHGGYSHASLGADSRTRYRRRTALLEELLDLHIKLGIKPPQPLPLAPGPPAPPPPAATDPPVTAGAVGGASAKPS